MSDTEPCMFPNLHEPFYCRIHADVRLQLTDERCRRGVTLTQPQPDAGLREADVLRANLASTADWLDAIIEESDPKPSELMAMVAGIRAALRSTLAAPKEDDRE